MSKVTPFAYRVKSMVKIIDGDTFDCILDLGFDVLLEARVRMAGIDTPERKQPFAANDNTSSNTYESSDRLDFYTTNM